MKYFTDCKTQEELKKEYRRLCKELHPDNGGNESDFKEMQDDFSAAGKTQAWSTYRNKAGETYQKETKETAEDFMKVIETLINLAGITLEICGTWLWITGNTKEHKDIIKSTGARYSKNKKCWYYHMEPYRKRSKRKISLEEIREMYGSELLKDEAALKG